MPFYYDDDGEMQFTESSDESYRKQSITMINANNYALEPNAIGNLIEVLGPTPDPSATRATARRKVRRVLDQMGLSEVPLSVAIEQLNESWQAVIKTGTATG